MTIPGLRQLFTPLNYLRIRRKTIKIWYDIWMPLGLTVLVIATLWMTGWKANLFGTGGIIAQVTELLKMLIGFYIAALAAIATFPSAVLDQKLAGEPTTLSVKRRGVVIPASLSRRRFLSYLFGYLAFMSLVMFIVGTVAQMAAPALRDATPQRWRLLIEVAGISFYLFWVFNMLVGTLLGLHYLTDRIHRPVDGNVAGSPETSNPR